jgi:signal transduction histidine kinase
MLNSNNHHFEDDFQIFASGIRSGNEEIRVVQIFQKDHPVYIYPLDTNEVTEGRSLDDLINDERANVHQDVQRTLETKEITLSQPYELRQGGTGIVARKAIYIEDELWGIAVIILDVPEILDKSGIHTLPNNIELTVLDQNHDVVFGSTEILDKEPISSRVELPEGHWELLAVPERGWKEPVKEQLLQFQIMTFLIMVLITALVYFGFSKHKKLAAMVERKEKDLSESQKSYQNIRNYSTSAFARHRIITNTNGTPIDYVFLDVNDAFEKNTGIKSKEIIGKRVTEIIPDIGKTDLIEIYGKVAQDKIPIRFTKYIPYLGRHYEITAYSPVKGEFVTIFTDVSREKEAEKELIKAKIIAEDANRTKSEFLTNMSHELRTPLNSVIGFSQILKKNKLNHLDEKEIKYVSNILKGGKHLLELVNNILDISKVETGNMDNTPENINVAEIIDDTITQVEPIAKKKSINLKHERKTDNMEINTDKMKFKEIMYNLLSNAIKFTPEGGEVQVKSKVTNEKLHVSVSDTGIGIPEDKIKSIFDPFKQVDSSTNRSYGGTGLGLALVKKFVEMHGGEISVKSEIGKGSTFTFTMPLE